MGLGALGSLGALTSGVVEVQGHFLAAHHHAGRVLLEHGGGVVLSRGVEVVLSDVEGRHPPPTTFTPSGSAVLGFLDFPRGHPRMATAFLRTKLRGSEEGRLLSPSHGGGGPRPDLPPAAAQGLTSGKEP